MAIRILDYLSPDEAAGLADFLVEMIALEEAVDIALVHHYARPGRGEEFHRQFVGRMTLGNKVQRLRPVIEASPHGGDLVSELGAVIEVRNAVAHRLPQQDYDEWKTSAGSDDEDIEVFRAYQTGKRYIDARTLADWARAAQSIRSRVAIIFHPDAPPDVT